MFKGIGIPLGEEKLEKEETDDKAFLLLFSY